MRFYVDTSALIKRYVEDPLNEAALKEGFPAIL